MFFVDFIGIKKNGKGIWSDSYTKGKGEKRPEINSEMTCFTPNVRLGSTFLIGRVS